MNVDSKIYYDTMKTHSSSYTRYEVIVQEDDETGDLILPIPPALLQSLDWKEGDEVDFNIDDKGNYVIKKVNK
jgi:hypothetical protein